MQLQADALRIAFLQEQERYKRLSTSYQDLQAEYKLFVATVQRLDSVAYQRTTEALTYVPPKPEPKPGKEKK